MTYQEMNEFICKYVEDDKSGRALMLSGDWGSGKSYYVNEILKPYLKGDKKKCIVVSLFGLSEVSEISKAIYLGARIDIKEKKSEAAKTAKVVGKIIARTIYNSLIEKIGFEIARAEDSDLQKVYESINLDNTLVVLEDLERTSVKLSDLLGFVNNLCECDKVKVLLVANEKELLVWEVKEDDQGKKRKVLTERSKEYKRVKEKIIGDTIDFVSDYRESIRNIIDLYNKPDKGKRKKKDIEKENPLNRFMDYDSVCEIQNIIISSGSGNLRAFKYSCQKMWDILDRFKKYGLKYDDDVIKTIYYGLIAFNQRKSKEENLLYPSDTPYSDTLGVNEYPLFRFCYRFIVNQELDKNEIESAIEFYKTHGQYRNVRFRNDPDLKILKDYYIQTDRKVIGAVNRLKKRIDNKQISYFELCSIVNYAIAIKYDIGIEIDVDAIIKSVVKSIKQAKDTLRFDELFLSSLVINDDEGEKKWIEFRREIRHAIVNNNDLEFPYAGEKIEEYCENKADALKQYINNRGFACRLDVDKFIEYLKKYSSFQISRLEALFDEIYTEVSTMFISAEEIKNLQQLRDRVKELKTYEGYDKIQKMRITSFLNTICAALQAVILKNKEYEE